MLTTRFSLSALFALLLASAAQAITLITPTGVTMNTGSQFFPVGNLINNSGLASVPTAANYTTVVNSGAGTWVTDAFFPDYYTGGGVVPVMTFDLGASQALTDVVTWNYNVPGNATRTITATFSTTGIGGPFSNPIVLTVPQPFPLAATIPLGSVINANAVRFSYNANWVGFGAGGDRVGLGEVKFLSNINIPEPATAALGLIGLAALARRRRVA